MRHGDLSNEVVPRLVLVFEGALGFISLENRRKFDRDIRREHWDDAASRWEINPLMAAKIWDVTRRLSFTLDVVTFASESPAYEGALYRRLDIHEELPIHGVIATTEVKFERRIAHTPDLARVYDPEAMRSMRWGGKGYHITDVNQLGA